MGVEKTEKYNSQKEKHEAFMNHLARQAADITLSRIGSHGEIEGETKEESEEKLRQKSYETWKEFAVHGITRFDEKDKKIKLLNFTDLDGKTCIGLLKLAGFDIKNVQYVSASNFVPGAINLDTGDKSGVVVSPEDGTAWFDHHGPGATEASVPASRLVYETLVAADFLKSEPALEKLTRFVSQIDRKKFPGAEKYFFQSDRTILGLHRFLSFENLYDYFKQGGSPIESLSDEDLKRYGLETRNKEQKGIIEQAKKVLGNLEKDGFILETKFGKVAIDVGKKLTAGYDAAVAAGLNGYLIYNPVTESYFLSIKNADLTNLGLSQGKNFRQNMWIKPQGKERLEMSLKEIIKKLGGQITKNSQAEKVIESLELRAKEFMVKPELTKDQRGNLNYTTRELGKFALFPKDFKPEANKKYRVRIKFDTAPGEKRGVYILEVAG